LPFNSISSSAHSVLPSSHFIWTFVDPKSVSLKVISLRMKILCRFSSYSLYPFYARL
jgi:hypothetical protein